MISPPHWLLRRRVLALGLSRTGAFRICRRSGDLHTVHRTSGHAGSPGCRSHRTRGHHRHFPRRDNRDDDGRGPPDSNPRRCAETTSGLRSSPQACSELAAILMMPPSRRPGLMRQRSSKKLMKQVSPISVNRTGTPLPGGRTAIGMEHPYQTSIPKLARLLSENLRASGGMVPALWPQFNSLRAFPTLTVRGENSDILTDAVLAKMSEVHPDFEALTLPNRGHAPFFDRSWSRAGHQQDTHQGRYPLIADTVQPDLQIRHSFLQPGRPGESGCLSDYETFCLMAHQTSDGLGRYLGGTDDAWWGR